MVAIFFLTLLLRKDETLILAEPKLGFLYSLHNRHRCGAGCFLLEERTDGYPQSVDKTHKPRCKGEKSPIFLQKTRKNRDKSIDTAHS